MLYSALKKVFSKKVYWFISISIPMIVFIFSVWLPNFKLISKVFTNSSATLYDKVKILYSLIGSIGTNFSAFSASYTISIAILFGLNIAMVAYYIRQRKIFLRQSGAATSFSGLIAGIFGIGCAACGTIILGPILVAVGAGGILVFLPFGGQLFGVLGVLILGFSIFFNAKKIEKPLTCDI